MQMILPPGTGCTNEDLGLEIDMGTGGSKKPASKGSNEPDQPQEQHYAPQTSELSKLKPMSATDLVAALPKPVNLFPQRSVAMLHYRDGQWWIVEPPAVANKHELNILTYNIWFDKSHRRRRFEALTDCIFSDKDCNTPDVVCFQVQHAPYLPCQAKQPSYTEQ